MIIKPSDCFNRSYRTWYKNKSPISKLFFEFLLCCVWVFRYSCFSIFRSGAEIVPVVLAVSFFRYSWPLKLFNILNKPAYKISGKYFTFPTSHLI